MMTLGPYQLGYNDTPECGIYHGDARELSQAIPDESISLIFTDPVYDAIDDYHWLAETAARVLKPDSWCLCFSYPENMHSVVSLMAEYLTYSWTIVWHRTNEIKYRYAPIGKSLYVPLLLFSKGQPTRKHFMFDVISLPVFTIHSNHQWSKDPELIRRCLPSMSAAGSIIFDPFTGGGTVPAVCKQLGRQYLAFEIDADTVTLARQRVHDTQPPLFVPQAEQLRLPTT